MTVGTVVVFAMVKIMGRAEEITSVAPVEIITGRTAVTGLPGETAENGVQIGNVRRRILVITGRRELRCWVTALAVAVRVIGTREDLADQCGSRQEEEGTRFRAAETWVRPGN